MLQKPIFYYSVHSGTTKGDVPMNFAAAERACYKEMIVPIFADFLRKCYSKFCYDWSLRVLKFEQVSKNVKSAH